MITDKILYVLHPTGNTGYCFDSIKMEVRSRRNGVETVLEPGSEEMGRANDVRTGNTLGFGVGEQGKEITEEEYLKL